MHRCIPLLGTLFLTAACTTLGPDFETPAAPAATTYAMAGDVAGPSPAQLSSTDATREEWWAAFGSAKINALVQQALENNPTLDAAEAALTRAQALESAARGGRAPQINASGSAARERINTAAFGISGFPSPTINLYSIGSAVSFDLDLFGRNRRQVENAAALAEAQLHRTNAAYLALTGNVVAKAIELASIRAQLAELDEIIRGDQQTMDMIRRGVEAGGAPKSATNTADAQLAEDQARRPPLVKRLAVTRHALALLVGKAPAQWAAPEIELADFVLPTDAPVQLPSQLVRVRPDILAAEAELHAATAAIGVAQADHYPDISLDAAFAFTALQPEDLFQYESSGWSAGPSVTAPLFAGGSLKARQRAAEATAREADAQYRQVVLSAFVQVADLLSAISSDQDLVAAQARASNIAEESSRLSSLAFDNGAGSLLSVIDAQRQVMRARFASVEAQAQLLSDFTSLYVATASGGYRVQDQ